MSYTAFLVSFLLLAVASSLGQGVNFSAAVSYGSEGTLAGSVAVADVNRDGKLDFIVTNSCSKNGCPSGLPTTDRGMVNVQMGKGDGTFHPAGGYLTGGNSPSSLAVADVNGDGNPDLLVANSCTNRECTADGVVGVLLGNGDGTFQAAVGYGSGGTFPNSVAVGDVNGDGRPDLLVANTCPKGGECSAADVVGGPAVAVVGVLLGNGDGTFQAAVSYGSGGIFADSIALGDVNGDGNLDLLVANQCTIGGGCPLGGISSPSRGVVGVLLGNGDGTFEAAVRFDSGGGGASSVAVGDVNGDGKSDLLVTNDQSNSVGVLLGNGDGSFQAAVNHPSGGDHPASLVLGDVNGDHRLDVLFVNISSDVVGVLLGDGGGGFGATAIYNSGGHGPLSVAVGDVNGDCRLDVLAANQRGVSGTNGSVGVLLNTPFVTIAGLPQQPLSKDSNGNFVALLTITNNGNITASSVLTTIAGTKLGTAALLTAPPTVTNLAPGASATVRLTFPASAASSASTTAPLKVSGTYSVPAVRLNGNWTLSFRSVSLK